ncbi:protein disulfide isomerase pTAC5, chloroplastic-like [Camellia sinensis]|uniref:protein disulfide isomerase pTAC5, chloroplastic-like n=1 Tax=Camellia sinensis TaxID=4442 RepID=UPI001036E2FC|nr:protein disulfide isomerase pTAC5, chloroplastic-like [Camellia sinensis]
MSSSLPLSFNPPLIHRPQPPPLLHPNFFSPFPISKPSLHSLSKPLISFSLSPSNNSNYDPEEARWLREEQRWLREEQRWLRQESRWQAERESLLCEISALRLRIQELERQSENHGVSVENVAALLQMLKKEAELLESGSSAVPMVLEAAESGGKVEEEVVAVKEVKRATLRKGSEGEDVRVMQEALQKLGFYSGEEDVEYSSFSSGTERAVKTWQATLGAREDGIMTAELQEMLYREQQIGVSGLAVNVDPKGNNLTAVQKEGANGAAVASITEISEIQQTVVEEGGVTEVEVSEHRVFLLGENRWEEPSRLAGRSKQVGGAKSKDRITKCLSCRGEGRLLCTECDGTGEPNIEPQFMEWVDEGAKCPYCEGLGYTICDMCEGKTVV